MSETAASITTEYFLIPRAITGVLAGAMMAQLPCVFMHGPYEIFFKSTAHQQVMVQTAFFSACIRACPRGRGPFGDR